MQNTRFFFPGAFMALLGTACLTTVNNSGDGGTGSGPAPTQAGTDPSTNTTNIDAIPYRDDLSKHPGCSTAGVATRAAGATNAIAYPPANIAGYKCAAKEYQTPNEDTTKPIVLLVHGNSSTPGDYEMFPNADGSPGTPMLSERLLSAGFKVFAVDGRFDLGDDPGSNNKTENAAKNMDHGWYVPLVQHFVDSMLSAYPTRKISIVAFSLGPTVVRDALRRLHRAGKKPFERIHTLLLASGANHGVATFRDLCGTNPTMRGKVTCEMGDRTAYSPTAFSTPNNGPNGGYETPCSDGNTAFGQAGVCGGNKVKYVTIVMSDPPNGTLQDEFVSEGSAALAGATNLKVGLGDIDTSNYFVKGAFKNHYGSIRSENGLTQIMAALTTN